MSNLGKVLCCGGKVTSHQSAVLQTETYCRFHDLNMEIRRATIKLIQNYTNNNDKA